MLLHYIFHDHDTWLLLTAVAICVLGSGAGIFLWKRASHSERREYLGWTVLASVVLGATVWTTHFVAMLAYEGSAGASFDTKMTAISIAVAVFGLGLTIYLSLISASVLIQVISGCGMGLAIATMHFVGMVGFQAGIDITFFDAWNLLATVFGCLLGFLCVRLIQLPKASGVWIHTATLSFSSAVVVIHFTAMLGFHERHAEMLSSLVPSDHSGMAVAVSIAAFLLIAAGAASYLLQSRLIEQSEADLSESAITDGLTGVLNRSGFNSTLEEWCEKSRATGYGFALLFVDLDRFKPVNDIFGHPVGDEVLRRLVDRLKNVTRKTDIVARLGGDEFAILVADIEPHSKYTNRLAERIVDVAARPFIIDTRIIEIGASVGVIEPGGQNPSSPDTLCRNADMALYEAKSAGRKTWRRFDAEIAERFEERRHLEYDLRRAVSRSEFVLHFQPVSDSETGQLVGAEALIRWLHPTRGILSPVKFVPLAEDLGLVIPIGRWVIETACRCATRWPETMRVSVNVSPVQMRDPRIVQTVRVALEKSGLPAHRLDLEVTESALMDNEEEGIKTLKQLRQLGVSISLDDFGTGFSALSHLYKFPLDRLKIDRSFINAAETDPKSAKIVEAISNLGEMLGLGVTAEGVETQNQFDFASRNGCDIIQGYLVSKPLPSSELDSLIKTYQISSEAKKRKSGT